MPRRTSRPLESLSRRLAFTGAYDAGPVGETVGTVATALHGELGRIHLSPWDRDSLDFYELGRDALNGASPTGRLWVELLGCRRYRYEDLGKLIGRGASFEQTVFYVFPPSGGFWEGSVICRREDDPGHSLLSHGEQESPQQEVWVEVQGCDFEEFYREFKKAAGDFEIEGRD